MCLLMYSWKLKLICFSVLTQRNQNSPLKFTHHTRWGPHLIAKLTYNLVISMVYGDMTWYDYNTYIIYIYILRYIYIYIHANIYIYTYIYIYICTVHGGYRPTNITEGPHLRTLYGETAVAKHMMATWSDMYIILSPKCEALPKTMVLWGIVTYLWPCNGSVFFGGGMGLTP